MSSIASIYKATSGLIANERALNVTGHNLANVNTKGFVRQQVLMSDSGYITISYNKNGANQLGMGVDLSSVRQVRDMFMDKSYRTEIGRQSFYGIQYEAIQEVEEIFGEIQGETFAGILDELWKSISELSKTPEGLETRGNLVQNASKFINRASVMMNQLSSYQINMNKQITDMTAEINKLGDEINLLNNKIVSAEITGEAANDYRDQRNLKLDRLAELIDISYREDASGSVTVLAEGRELVSDGRVSKITLEPSEANSPLLKPVWGNTGIDVFDLSRPIIADKGQDTGALKGLLITRGSSPANYTDMSSPDYETRVKPSTIMNAMAQFDQLVNSIVTMINDILSPIDSSTNQLADDAPYGMDGSKGYELFSRKHVSRFDASGEFNKEDPNSFSSLYTATNLVINPEILHNYNKLCLAKDPKNLAEPTIVNNILAAWDSPLIKQTPGSSTFLNVTEYYTEVTSDIGHRGQVSRNMFEAERTMVNFIDNQRLQLTGVSSDEELGNMMRFQHAYNASARVVNVLDSMLGHLIERVGIVGR